MLYYTYIVNDLEVNLEISTKGRYALRILADIAEHRNGKNVPIREIAER